jgi:hypothetical protein
MSQWSLAKLFRLSCFWGISLLKGYDGRDALAIAPALWGYISFRSQFEAFDRP